jgi:hypothetical protein
MGLLIAAAILAARYVKAIDRAQEAVFAELGGGVRVAH